MFGMFKKSAQPALPEQLTVFDNYDLSDAKPADLKWAKRFYKSAKKTDTYDALILLDKALKKRQHFRIAMGLHIQKKFPDKNLLRNGPAYNLYNDVWMAPPEIARMYIETYYPTHSSMKMDYSQLQPIFSGLSASTCIEYAERGCGEFLDPVFHTLIQKGTADQIETFYAKTNRKINSRWRDNQHLKEAIKREDPEIIQIVLNQQPDLNIDTMDILNQALESDKTEPLQLLIKAGINVFRQNQAIFTTAKTNNRFEHLEILEAVKAAKTGTKRGTDLHVPPAAAPKQVEGWTALSETFAEYKCPESDDGSKAKYQFDFTSGYMTYQYVTKDYQAAPVLKTIGELFAENQQFVEKAVSTIAAHGFPAPDLDQYFNQAGAKPSLQKIEKPATVQLPKRRR